MQLIISHTNADFDSLSGMVAASKLYPDALLLFPGSIEKNLRDFIEKYKDNLPQIISSKQIDKKEIDEIILVDVGSRKRLGTFSQFLEGKKVTVFDHHPGLIDVESTQSFEDECGSVTTMFVNILEEKKIKVTPFEATLFLLGIYEDTGFLTFPTTREKDFDAAKKCLMWGGKLTEVSKWLTRRLTETQLKILTKLIENLETYVIGGTKIHLTTFSSTEFHPDLSLLLSEILNSEDIDVVFLVAFLESRVHIIGRSRNPEVDVGKILEEFGGGGHASAGSSTVKNATLDEARRKLLEILFLKSNIGYKAKEFLKKDFARGSKEMTINDVLFEMNKYRINALPLFDGNRAIGVVTRQEVDKSIQLNMGERLASTLIVSKPPIFSEDQSIENIYRIMLDKSYRVVLIGSSEENIVGIISRWDLQKKLSERLSSRISRSQGGVPSPEEIKRIFEGFFLLDELKNLKEIGELASNINMRIYLVGGVVRDILLRRKVKDLDFVVEGDATILAKKWCDIKGGRCKVHNEFQTAVWIKPDKSRWDFATARIEYYQFPAALPIVESAKLENDLSRRDFTINSMAISLNPDNFNQLIDPFGGIKDLRQSTIKVLHNLSIFDDPTRAFRAVRFAATLNFSIHPETKQLIINALKEGIFKNLSSKRVLSEMFEILKSPSFIEALNLLEELNILKFFFPSLKLTPKVKAKLYKCQTISNFFEENFPKEHLDKPAFLLLPLIENFTKNEIIEFTKSYPLPKKTKEILLTFKESLWKFKKVISLNKNDKFSLLDLFSQTPLLIILFYLSRCDREEEQVLIKDYLTKERFVKLEINGDDLKKCGLKPDKYFRNILLKTKVAKIEGLIKEKEDELEYALNIYKEMEKKGYEKN